MKRLTRSKETMNLIITPVMSRLMVIEKAPDDLLLNNKDVISDIQTFLNNRGYCCEINGVLTESTIRAFITRVNDCDMYAVKCDVLYPKDGELNLTDTGIGYLSKLCNYIIPNLGLNPVMTVTSSLLLAVNDALDYDLFRGIKNEHSNF